MVEFRENLVLVGHALNKLQARLMRLARMVCFHRTDLAGRLDKIHDSRDPVAQAGNFGAGEEAKHGGKRGGKEGGEKREGGEGADAEKTVRKGAEKAERERARVEKAGETGKSGRDRKTAEEDSGRKWRDKKSVGLDDQVRNRFIIMDIVVQVAA